MELFKEILIKVLEKERVEVMFPDLVLDLSKVIEGESYRALQKIKGIIEDGRFDDKECFARIERTVQVFEKQAVTAAKDTIFDDSVGATCGRPRF